MKVFITSGTTEYLMTIMKKSGNEKMIIMQDEDDASLLYHETTNGTVFKEPRKYEIIDASGSIGNAGFIVMNHIPVTDEGRPLFEYRFKNRAKMIEKQPGFEAIRVLRPLISNTYIILTAWDTEDSFEEWRKSNAFGKAHHKSGAHDDQQLKIFSGQSYVLKFIIPKEDD